MSPTRYHYATLLVLTNNRPTPFQMLLIYNTLPQSNNPDYQIVFSYFIIQYLMRIEIQCSSIFAKQIFILFQNSNKFYSKRQKMSDFNSLHYRNLNIQSIVIENQQLRRVLHHAAQNQEILEQLSLKIELYKGKELDLISNNHALMEKMKSQQRLLDEREGTYSEEMRYVFEQHDKILQAKDDQIGFIRHEMQNLVQVNRELDDAARHHQQRERNLNINYENQLSIYKNRILQFQHEIEMVNKSAQNQRYNFQKGKASWSIESENQIANILQLTNTIKALQSDNLLLINYSKQIQLTLMKTKQQDKLTLLSLRQRLIQQQDQIQKYLYVNAELDNNCKLITRQLEDVKRKQAHVMDDNESLKEENQKIIQLLHQSDKQSLFLRTQLTQLELNFDKIIQNKENQLHDIKNEKLQLLQSKTQVDSYLNIKISQLRQASASANSLQTLVGKQQTHINNLTSNLNQLQQRLQKQQKKATQLLIQVKQLRNSNEAIKMENYNLEQINNRLQIQISQIENQSKNLARSLVIPKDINKQFIDQMNKMLIKFGEEREEQNRSHLLEKQKLKDIYQFEIKQRQMDLLKKIALLEEQVSFNKQFEILAERNNTIYTYTSKY